jgi:AraC-like DNA-binding protein
MILPAPRLFAALTLTVLATALLWRPRRAEPSRIWLGAVLAVNALLVAGSGAGWLSPIGAPVGFSLFFASFSLSPLGLVLVFRRLAHPLPASLRDGVAFAPAVVLAAALVLLSLLWRGGHGPYATRAVWIIALAVLHTIALTAFWLAARDARGAPGWAQAMLGLFGVHWALSGSSAVAGVAGLGGGAALETASITALLVFGLFAAGVGVAHLSRRLPEVPRTVTPDDFILAERLRVLFESERVHLDAELTLQALAVLADANERDVSRVLSAVLGGGYHDVVRRYRVAEAQRLLRDKPEFSVLRILHEAGFNSKSAFHRAFIDVAGITPSEYRNRHRRAPVE